MPEGELKALWQLNLRDVGGNSNTLLPVVKDIWYPFRKDQCPENP